jgi:TonB family protein
VLLANPDQAEARQGLARTIDLLLMQAASSDRQHRRHEAERLVQRVLAVQPDNAHARALARRLAASETPSSQLQLEQVAGVQAQATIPAVAAPAPAITKQAVPRPATVALTSASRTAASTEPLKPGPPAATDTKPRSLVTPSPVPYRDPLTPKATNAIASPTFASTPRTRSYGAPIDNHLPKAGYASYAAPPVQSNEGASQSVVAKGARATSYAARIGSAISADAFDRLASRDPVYPRDALRARTSGWVELEFTITPTGAVSDIRIVGAEPTGVFDAAATDALAAWRFKPRVVNGRPLAQRSTITMHFDVDS